MQTTEEEQTRGFSGGFRALRIYTGFQQQIQATDRCSQLFESTVRKCSILPLPGKVFGLPLQEKEAASGFHRVKNGPLSLALTQGCSHQARCETLDNVKSEQAE